jgi:short-subunit dehydrogenase
MKIIILGALSGIAEATCRDLAKDGAELLLVGRGAARLQAVADDLIVRGAKQAAVMELDLSTANASDKLNDMRNMLGGADGLLLAYGQLGDPAVLADDPDQARDLITVNFASAAAWCLAAANLFERQGHGHLVVIGSVAGDRGRQSNYIYGSTKAGLATLVQGLAHRFAGTKVRAILIKPGLVDTAMTAHMPKGGPLWASAAAVGAKVANVLRQPKGDVVYAPAFWWLVMTIIRHVPDFIFKRTKL